MSGIRDGALLEHLQAEHHKLNLALSSISKQPQSMLVASLLQLRNELQVHCCQAESEGCLEEARLRCPSAGSQLASIQSQHEQLLRMLDDLIYEAAQTNVDCEASSRRFDGLRERLHAHETAESRLLLYALGGDTAEYDVEGDE